MSEDHYVWRLFCDANEQNARKVGRVINESYEQRVGKPYETVLHESQKSHVGHQYELGLATQ